MLKTWIIHGKKKFRVHARRILKFAAILISVSKYFMAHFSAMKPTIFYP
jgi:hypothetical protein